MAMSISSVPPLQGFRKKLVQPALSQEKMAHLAGVSLQTYRRSESGEDLCLSTAVAIWRALNREREARGLNQVSFENLWLER